MKISVITPSIRLPELELVRESLTKQTFDDFEWIVCSPFEYRFARWIQSRPKNEDDFWGYCKAMNDLFKVAKGYLVVVCNDSQYLKKDVLQRFWTHFEEDPTSCVAGLGNHYKKVVNGVGVDETYHDVRFNQYSSFQGATETSFDSCLCSIPYRAILFSQGINEVFDKVCCYGDREMMVRIRRLGFTLNIDPKIEFVAQKHTKEYDPLNKWGEKFVEGEKLYNEILGI